MEDDTTPPEFPNEDEVVWVEVELTRLSEIAESEETLLPRKMRCCCWLDSDCVKLIVDPTKLLVEPDVVVIIC